MFVHNTSVSGKRSIIRAHNHSCLIHQKGAMIMKMINPFCENTLTIMFFRLSTSGLVLKEVGPPNIVSSLQIVRADLDTG